MFDTKHKSAVSRSVKIESLQTAIEVQTGGAFVRKMYFHCSNGRKEICDWRCKNHTKEVRLIPDGYHIVGVYGKYSKSMLECPGFIVMRDDEVYPENYVEEEKKGH